MAKPGKLNPMLRKAKKEGWSEWIRSEADERAVMNGCWFDANAGQKWVEFFAKFLRHTRGNQAGQPFVLLDWQRDDLIMPLYGWKRDRSRPHLRRFRKGDVFVAKKQGKSTIAAGIAIGTLVMGGERSEIYGVAHTRDQASIIYAEAAAMVGASAKLDRHMQVIDSKKRVIFPRTNSYYTVLAGEKGAKATEGINPTLILFDEIHVQKSRKLYDALTYASAAQDNALMLSVSTVGVADKTAIWWEQYEYAKGILAGDIYDDTRFAYVAQADEECKEDAALRADPEQWRKAMPSLGHTVKEERIAEAVREAENSPAKLNSLLRYMFNIPTAQVNRVVPMGQWYDLADEIPDLTGRMCVAGLDVASSEDLTALSLWFPPVGDETRGFLVNRFWCPEAKILEREKEQMAFYVQWERDGHLFKTEGNRIDHDTIYEYIMQASMQYKLAGVFFDVWNADGIVNRLMAEGVECFSVPQTFRGMSNHCQTFLNKIAEGEIIHDNNPVMNWCCSNVAADTMGDAIRFNKDKSAEKIDGAISAAMAIGGALALEHKADDEAPVEYQREGGIAFL